MQLTWPAPNRRFGVIDALALVGVVGLLVARFIPVARLPFWGCVLRETTGWPCFGCGLTRVAERMSHFNFAGAWDANPLGMVAAALFMLCILASLLHLSLGVPLPEVTLTEREKTFARAGVVMLVLVNYVWLVMKTRFPELLAGI